MRFIDALLTIAISAAPVFELRGGIPYALAREIPPVVALLLALVGNLAIVPILLWGFEHLEALFGRWAPLRRLMESVFARSRRKGRWVERFGAVGLILLVAVPFPGTGAWTGAVVARLLGLSNRRALIWISVGVVIAGGLVLLASLGVIALAGMHTR